MITETERLRDIIERARLILKSVSQLRQQAPRHVRTADDYAIATLDEANLPVEEAA